MRYDQEISFEAAKIAKLRGFPQRQGDEGGYDAIGGYCGDFALDAINGRECYRIASQGELAAWLREEHQIHIILEILPNVGGNIWEGSIQNINNGVYVSTEIYEGMAYNEVVEELLVMALLVHLAPNDGNLL